MFLQLIELPSGFSFSRSTFILYCSVVVLQVVIGPATVGGIQAGAFKIGDTAGTIDNIIQCKLYRPGSVGFVSKSVSSHCNACLFPFLSMQ